MQLCCVEIRHPGVSWSDHFRILVFRVANKHSKALGKNRLKGSLLNHTRPNPAATIPSLFYLLLVEYPRYFWHPLLAPLAPKFPLWRQIARVIQCPCHDISKVLHRRCTDFQDTASACGAKFSVESCATPVICFVYGRFFGLGSIGEGGHRDFCCQSECCSEEFLARYQH